MDPRFPVFDGHNDTLLRLDMAGGDPEPFFAGRLQGQLDLPRARRGGFVGGFFAVFVPSPNDVVEALTTPDAPNQSKRSRPRVSRDHVPYPDAIDHVYASNSAGRMVDLLDSIAAHSSQDVQVLRSLDDLEAWWSQPPAAPPPDEPSDAMPLGAVLHFEGAEPIRRDLADLEHWYARGLRSLGLVWSRANDFAYGVPFRYPSTPDHYGGLSSAGFDLVRACDELGILIDLSHLNEKGFWDVARTTSKPLVVTHTGALSVCPSSRNLTTDQIRAVGDSGGVVGVTFHCGDLRPDGRLNPDTSLDIVVDHLDAFAEIVGAQHVAIGSDFDGALIPRDLADVAALPRLLERLSERGWSEPDIEAVAATNWLRALRRAWS